MFQVTRDPLGPSETDLQEKWRELARTLLSEEHQENDNKISLLKEAVLARADLSGLHDSKFIHDNGFLMR